MSETTSGVTGQVTLADGQSGLSILYQLLNQAAQTFTEAFAQVNVAVGEKRFRAIYGQLLPEFELARLCSPQRHQIGQFMCEQLQQFVCWQSEAGEVPLSETLQLAQPGLALQQHSFAGEPGWSASVVYRGQRHDGAALATLGQQLAQRGLISAPAGQSLSWLHNHALTDGKLNLQGRKIAVLGGGAEMAPTRLWLEAGAEVLWLDVQAPPEDWFGSESLAGTLWWPQQPADLLTQPQAILATLLEFADGQPLDLGLYAYAPGQARELRLTACMNALVEALPAQVVGTVTMLVSPTTPTALSDQDLQMMQTRRQQRPTWEALCDGLRLLGQGGGALSGTSQSAASQTQAAAVTRTVVTIQGASYQAAQYLGKILMAETWSTSGQLGGTGQALRVSANTAAITRTRSLAHPVFTAAFGGAAAMAVETMTPRQSSRLNGMLAVSDWLQEELPVPGQIRVHGGIHTLPYPLESALRIAAGIGFARSPRLLRGLFGGT